MDALKITHLQLLFSLDYKRIVKDNRPGEKWFSNGTFLLHAERHKGVWYFAQYTIAGTCVNPGNAIEHLIV